MISKEDLENGGIFRCNGDKIGMYMQEGDLCIFEKSTELSKNEFPYRMKILKGETKGFSTYWKWCDELEKGLDKI